MPDKDLEFFEEAFSDDSASCRGFCQCGKGFYNTDGGWDWEDGEIDEMKKNGYVEIPYAIKTIYFEGKEYIDSCDCWQDRATALISFIQSHGHSIVDFLSLVKDYKVSEAQALPEMKSDRTASST